jgi:hypothetical protein
MVYFFFSQTFVVRYATTAITTAVKSVRLAMLNARQTISAEVNAWGAMSNRQPHTPKAHQILMSADDFRLIILAMSGMLNSGNETAAMNAIFSIIGISCIGNAGYYTVREWYCQGWLVATERILKDLEGAVVMVCSMVRLT